VAKRIAFTLASLEREKNTYVAWFSTYAVRDGVSLFVFPGGRLHHLRQNEYLDNPLYWIVEDVHPDCLVSWASSIGGTATLEDITSFHEKTFRMPFVTIMHKIEGHCDVSFNAYSAMKEEILHLFEVHHRRKIAFLRGPETHRSAEERYLAYCAVMRLKGYEVDPRLVSSPSQWHEWDRPIRELVEKRGLRPGVDFDAIVCVNDDVMYATSTYLEGRGCRIPSDVGLVGFNDSLKALLMPCPGTTVEMPVKRLAEKAWELALHDGVGQDYSIPCTLKLRKSCGCVDSLSGIDRRNLKGGRKEFAAIASRYLDVPQDEVLSLMSKETTKGYLKILEESLLSYLPSHGDMSTLLDVLSLYYERYATDFFKDCLFLKIVPLLSSCTDRIRNEAKYKESIIERNLSRIKDGVVLATDYEAVINDVMGAATPLDIEEFHLVFRRNDDTCEYAGGFDEQKRFPGDRLFPSRQLLPAFVKTEKSGTYTVLPIHGADAFLGYVVVFSKHPQWRAIDEIRSFLNLSLPAVRLHVKTIRLAQKTEETYTRKTAFLKSVSDEMTRISNDCLSCGSSTTASQLSLLRNRIEMGIDGERLIKETCSLNAVFSQAGLALTDPLPVVMGNVRLLGEMLETIKRTRGVKGVRAESCENGVNVSLSLEKPAELSVLPMVSETMTVHEGKASGRGKTLVLSFPYPRLFSFLGTEGSTDYTVTDDDADEGISLSSLIERGIPEDVRTLFWKASFHSRYAMVVFEMLKAQKNPMRIASTVIQTGFESVEDAIRKDLAHFKVPLLYCNKLDGRRRDLLSQEFETMQADDRNGFLRLQVKAAADLLLVAEDENLLESLLPSFSCPFVYAATRLSSSVCRMIREDARVFPINGFMLEKREFIHRMGGLRVMGRAAEMVKKAVLFINEHDPREINRSRIAKEVGVCDDYLTKLFVRVLGVSPRAYVLSFRISLACRLLDCGDMALKEIAVLSGFSDASYFCRVFRATTGVSPDAYRRRKKQ